MWKFFSPLKDKDRVSSRKCDQGNSSRFKPEQRIRGLFDDPRLLQQVLGYLGPDDGSGGCEFHLQVLAKAAGVVVYCCAGISKGLDQRVDLQDLLAQRAIVGLRAANMFHFKKAEIFKALVWTHSTRSRWPLCCCTFPKKVRCWTIKWALSVFPAPLSPLIIIH